MEKQVAQAVDDISLITSIIKKTRQSFSGFSKIFIIWGLMYLVMTGIQLIQGMNIDKTITFYNQYPFIMYLIPLLLFGVGFMVLIKVTKAQPLLGLERHLMTLWVLVIFMQFMRIRVEMPLNDTMSTVIYSTSNLAIMVYALGTALVMTGIFTELKHLKVMGAFCIAIGFIDSYGSSMPALSALNISQTLDTLGYIIMPFTLLYTGLYLKKHHEGSTYGTQLNS